MLNKLYFILIRKQFSHFVNHATIEIKSVT